jgi:hypothetical protein
MIDAKGGAVVSIAAYEKLARVAATGVLEKSGREGSTM